MPLTSIAPILKQARQAGYAVPLFDAFDMFSAEGIFRAAEERRAPVIVAMYSGIMNKSYTRSLADFLRSRAASSPIPVSLMLDHGASFEECIRAIKMGFTDVMYDGSKLPFEENLAQTQAVVRAAHAAGLAAEAELGHVGMGDDYASFGSQRQGFTDPNLVERFVAESGVDFLAVAIGNAHGLYKDAPRIDLALLDAIQMRSEIPLVLHGGTGLSEEQFRAVIQRGIAKINVATDLLVFTTRRIGQATQDEKTTYYDLIEVALDSFQERCSYYLDLFGSSGKAYQ